MYKRIGTNLTSFLTNWPALQSLNLRLRFRLRSAPVFGGYDFDCSMMRS